MARQEAAAQTEKELAKADAKVDADAKAERESKEVAARMDASAENFQLGQDTEDAVNGQGAMFSFAGARAETADKHAMTVAQERIAAGEDAELVRRETGWHKAADGKWRFEISDDEAMVRADTDGSEGRRTFAQMFPAHAYDSGLTVGNVLWHPKLLAAYPAVADIQLKYGHDMLGTGTLGAFSNKTNTITLNATDSWEGALSTLLHEIQHGIQNIEGFATGGAPSQFADPAADRSALSDGAILSRLTASQGSLEKAKTEFAKRFKREPAFGAEAAALSGENPDSMQKRAAQMLEPHERYRRLAGETEARNTQTRQKLTDAERRATPPSKTADVVDSDVIVTFNVKEMANAPAPANAPSSDSNARLVATQMLVDGLKEKWTRAPEILVARHMQDPLVPQRVRDYDAKLKSQGSDGEARGFIYQGKVYLLSDQLKGPQQIAEVLFHEVLGHYGLSGAFGDALVPILQQLGVARRKEVLAKAREYGMVDKTLSDADAWAAMSAKDRESAAEEVLAEMAQSHPELGFVKRAIAAIRNWLRAHVPGFKSLALTDADIIQAHILPARGFVTRSQETGAQSLERALLAFSRDTNAGMATNDVVGNTQGGRSADDQTDGVRAATRQIIEAMRADEDSDYALRVLQDDVPAVDTGDALPRSRRWDDGIPTSEELSGTSGAEIKAPNEMAVQAALRNLGAHRTGNNGYYPGSRIILIKGERSMVGEDPGEVLLLNAEVVKIWKKAGGDAHPILPNESTASDGSDATMFSRGGPPQPQPPAGPAPGLLSGLQSRVRDLTSRESVDSWLYNWQDKFIDLKRIQDAIKALNGTVSDTNNAYRGEELYHKRVAKRTSNFLRDEVRPLLQRLNDAKVQIKDFERFLHARHAPEANAAMAERNLSAAQLDAKRTAADQQVKDLRLQLQRAQAQGLATTALQKALGQALVEQDDWKSAQAFKGTEEERLSLSGMSDQEAGAVMAALSPAQRTTMDGLAARVDAINAGTLKTLEDYGLMDRPTLNAWRNAYQHYVPLHRDEAHPDSTAHPIGQGFSVKGSASRQRTGSNEKVTNIFGHVMMQREAALTRGEKNNVTKKLYLLAAQNPDPDIWSLDLPKKKVLDPDTGLVRTMVDQGAKLRDNVVTVRIGGKDKFIVFNERNERAVRLSMAMRNLDAHELDRFTRSMGRLTRWFSAVNTQYNPIFGFVNLARDSQAVLLQLTNTPLAGKQKQVLKGMRSNMFAIYKDLRRERKEAGAGQGPWATLWEQLQLDGGTTGFRDLYANPEDRAESLQKALDQQGQSKTRALGREVMGWLSDFNETMEATTRLAVYKVALDSGIGREQAASIAKNITVNFNRKGRNTSVAGSYYAFLNAAIQGNARMLETLTGPQGRKIMAGGVMLGMLSSFAGALVMGGDGADDEWKKIPEFVKERSIIIPLGPKDYVAIPMPLGFHVFPNIGRKLVEMAMHDDPTKSRMNHVLDMALIALNAYNPLGGSENVAQMLTPTPFDPVVSLMTNKDWTGKPIYKEQRSGLDPQPGHAMAKDSATPVSRWVARLVNGASGGNEWRPGAWSPNPDAIEYLFGQITGGVGREATKLGNMATAAYTGEELAPHQIVLAGRFYGNTGGVNGQSSRYYENLKRVNTSMNEAKGRSERGEGVDVIFADVPLARLDGPANVLDKRVQDLVKMRRKIQASDEPNKRELVKEVNAEMERNMRLLNQAVADVLKGESEK